MTIVPEPEYVKDVPLAIIGAGFLYGLGAYAAHALRDWYKENTAEFFGTIYWLNEYIKDGYEPNKALDIYRKCDTIGCTNTLLGRNLAYRKFKKVHNL